MPPFCREEYERNMNIVVTLWVQDPFDLISRADLSRYVLACLHVVIAKNPAMTKFLAGTIVLGSVGVFFMKEIFSSSFLGNSWKGLLEQKSPFHGNGNSPNHTHLPSLLALDEDEG